MVQVHPPRPVPPSPLEQPAPDADSGVRGLPFFGPKSKSGTFPFYGPSDIPLGAHRDLGEWALALARPPTTLLWCYIPELKVPTTASGACTLSVLNTHITAS